ncbi:MAG: fused MFS/spermidine synthase [Rhodospirillaceae bacterium]
MPLYAATIFLGAFLLFLVQPIIARQILPWFGGAAAVWTTCLVFFQTALLLGYAYADWTTRRIRPRAQLVIHIVLLAVSLSLLPVVPDAVWKPGGEQANGPVSAILGLLTATIGLQYFLLAATSPLLQSWYWRRYRHEAPYRLFALSNFASLLALLAYPFLVEPYLPLLKQSQAWSVAYALFAVLCGATGWISIRRTAVDETAPVEAAEPFPSWRTSGAWLVLSALGSCLLLAVSNHLTQNIASVPFLWVVPLSLYLITFILCFDHPRWYRRPVYLASIAILLPFMAWAGDTLELWLAAPLYAAGLFVCCMFCHGELYNLRPAPRHLTSFYLMIAAGGALGALFVGLGAPALLSGYYEVEMTLVACAVLLIMRTRTAPRWVCAGVLATAMLTTWFTTHNVKTYLAGARVAVRNFYGVVRTRDFEAPVPYRAMYHGAIDHGGQLLDTDFRREPTSYFGLTSGYGRVFRSLPPGPRRIGVVGLGAGVIAAYARRGDVFRFYEIDPQVAAVASLEFSYLRDSPAQIELALGDGRLSLEREPPQQFDLLAIDAFSGDSIPMHLLTREAMATYVRHLRSDGVLVFQATNRFVDIAPVLERLAAEFGFHAALISDAPDNQHSTTHDYWISHTDQIVITRNAALLAGDALRDALQPLVPRPDFRVWTDDYYNLMHVLKRP